MRVLTFKLFSIFAFLCVSGAAVAQNLRQAEAHVSANPVQFNLTPATTWLASDSYTDSKTGIFHAYFTQTIEGIQVEHQMVTVHLSPEGEVFHSNGNFLRNAADYVTNSEAITALQALQAVLTDLEITPGIGDLNVQEVIGGADKEIIFDAGTIAGEPINVRLQYFTESNGKFINLAWRVYFAPSDYAHDWVIHVDAETGAILQKVDGVISCNFGHGHKHNGSCSAGHNHEHEGAEKAIKDYVSAPTAADMVVNGDGSSYLVFPIGTESPIHATTLNTRTLVNCPATANASPFGWHDTNGVAGAEFTITRGNNAFAYDDRNNSNGPGASPDGGAGLDFSFPINFNQAPINYLEAATTNLFYWSNIMHDVFYEYGFTVAADAYQENNYGNPGGNAGDGVLAECQDAADNGVRSNANFAPTTGRMQMYLWDTTNPERDGDLDNGIIAHEYGHGISTRLTGGPSSYCLNNSEQMGEGWSDFFGLVLTVRPGDNANTPRGIGTYALGQPTTGNGIRPHRYSRDMVNINPHTYADAQNESVPHGVGSVWCVMIWDLFWNLVDAEGYDNDLYTGTGGNNIAINLVTQGLALLACDPTFVTGRDAILAADAQIYGGQYNCLIWETFARRGVGVNAQDNGTGIGGEVEDFTTPNGVNLTFDKSGDVTSGLSIGDVITFTVTATGAANACGPAPTNLDISDILPTGLKYVAGSASNGGTENNGTITWPTIATLNGSVSYTYQTVVTPLAVLSSGGGILIDEDVENGAPAGWTIANVGTGTGDWGISNARSNSPSNSFLGPDNDAGGFGAQEFLQLYSPVVNVTGPTTIQFDHHYITESNWDGGWVDYSTDGGTNWQLLTFNTNSYNNFVANNAANPAFGGNSGGFIQSIANLDLCGSIDLQLRFIMFYDNSVTDEGWYVDDVLISSQAGIVNLATAQTATLTLTDAECIEVNEPIVIAAKVMLQGPYNGTDMNDDLRNQTLVPLTEPYTGLGYTFIGSGGGECIDANILNVAAPIGDNIVDWVVVELRSGTGGSGAATTVIDSRAALVQADGDIVDIDGVSPVVFSQPAGNYRVAVRHRNHLGMMTEDAVFIDLLSN